MGARVGSSALMSPPRCAAVPFCSPCAQHTVRKQAAPAALSHDVPQWRSAFLSPMQSMHHAHNQRWLEANSPIYNIPIVQCCSPSLVIVRALLECEPVRSTEHGTSSAACLLRCFRKTCVKRAPRALRCIEDVCFDFTANYKILRNALIGPNCAFDVLALPVLVSICALAPGVRGLQSTAPWRARSEFDAQYKRIRCIVAPIITSMPILVIFLKTQK